MGSNDCHPLFCQAAVGFEVHSELVQKAIEPSAIGVRNPGGNERSASPNAWRTALGVFVGSAGLRSMRPQNAASSCTGRSTDCR